MFEPFIWMFKAENFNKRVLQLFLSMLLLILIALVLYAVSAFLINDFYIKYTLLILAAIFYISSSLVVQGYFWELTSSIISRDVDIVANNIYSGKIKSVFVISLPEFKPAKFIWRGFASIVASIMMVLPYALLVFSTAFTGVFTLPMLEIGNFHSIYAICYNLLYVFFFAFLPAMLWNYAKENSVFAVWNIRKAVYLLGTYPGKYILNTFVFVIFYLLNWLFVYGLILLTIPIQIQYLQVLICNFAASILYLYSLHVYAYLLATITPPGEG